MTSELSFEEQARLLAGTIAKDLAVAAITSKTPLSQILHPVRGNTLHEAYVWFYLIALSQIMDSHEDFLKEVVREQPSKTKKPRRPRKAPSSTGEET